MTIIDFLEVVLQEKDSHVQKVYLFLRVDCLLVCVNKVEESLVGFRNPEVLFIHRHA